MALNAIRKYGNYEGIPMRLLARLGSAAHLRERTDDGRRVPFSLQDCAGYILKSTLSEFEVTFRPNFKAMRLILRNTMDECGWHMEQKRIFIGLFAKQEVFRNCVYSYLNPVKNRDIPSNAQMCDLREAADRYGDAICKLLGIPRPEAVQQGVIFLTTLRENVLALNTRPVFHDPRPQGDIVITPLPGFEHFFTDTEISEDPTTFIEKAPDVARPDCMRVKTLDTLYKIPAEPCDSSKVKQFTLVSKDGRSLDVVSKRLAPVKSAFAEDEMETSIKVFNLGIPTPEPVATVRHGGNLYFLWRRVESAAFLSIKWEDNIREQARSIARKLSEAGLHHLDIDDRNFLLSEENGEPKVYIIDFEFSYWT